MRTAAKKGSVLGALTLLLAVPAAEASLRSDPGRAELRARPAPAALAPTKALTVAAPASPFHIFPELAPAPAPGQPASQKLASGPQTWEPQLNIKGINEFASISQQCAVAYHRNRWLDTRTGQWLSQDPQGDVDSPNLYAFVANQPWTATDPMGTIITFANKEASDTFRSVIDYALKNESKEGYAVFLAGILALDRSPIEYALNVAKKRSSNSLEGVGGITEPTCVDEAPTGVSLTIGMSIFNPHMWSARSRLAHELQHAIQFEFGRISFLEIATPGKPLQYRGGVLYDVHDEMEAFRTQGLFTESYEASPFGTADQRRLDTTLRLLQDPNAPYQEFVRLNPGYVGKPKEEADYLTARNPAIAGQLPGTHYVPIPGADHRSEIFRVPAEPAIKQLAEDAAAIRGGKDAAIRALLSHLPW